MKQSAIIISNINRTSSTIAAGLFGYGYHVETANTFQGARILLRSGIEAKAIIVDMLTTAQEISEFIRFVRHDLHNDTSNMIVIHDKPMVHGADTLLPRPANLEDVLRMVAKHS